MGVGGGGGGGGSLMYTYINPQMACLQSHACDRNIGGLSSSQITGGGGGLYLPMPPSYIYIPVAVCYCFQIQSIYMQCVFN